MSEAVASSTNRQTAEAAESHSLFRENNSLFRCVGNSYRKRGYDAII
jgi:hypothetical protein